MDKILLVVAAVLLSSACSVDKNYANYLKTQEVETRVAERWDALIKKDNEKAYQYTAPSFRDVTSEKEYIQTLNPRIIWKKFEIRRVKCDDEVCKINVKADYRIPPMFGIPQGMEAADNVQETWLSQEGEWFYLPPTSQ
jgi:hypothetical protein